MAGAGDERDDGSDDEVIPTDSSAAAALDEAAREARRAGLLLRHSSAGLELAVPGGPAVGAASELLQRPRGGERDLLWRAVLAGKGSVIDATAGLGADAFHLAAKGARVTMIERSPVLAALLGDALERALAGSFGGGAAEAARRLTLVVGDAVAVLGVAADRKADVVYLDPMFAATGHRAAPPKGMAVLRVLFADEVAPDVERELELLAAARRAAVRRAVVKRARKAAPLASVRPSGSITGRTVRYDIYPPL